MNRLHSGCVSAVALSLMTFGCGTSSPSDTSAAVANAPDSATCARLVGAQAAGATVVSAKYVEAGEKTPPLNIPASSSFCQVTASTSAAPTSTIKIEMWMPTKWNGKLLGVGGSGTTGGLVTAALTFPKPVSSGYATMATDAGHDAGDPPVWALKQPERIVDYGHRATHVGTEVAKALTELYYGSPSKRAYFQGCSNGGRDGLMLAQRYPDDYDGIIAGAPANNFVSLMTNLTNYRSLMEKLPPDSLSPKMKTLHAAAVKSCDALDGAKDGLIENPRDCRFDPAELSCKAGQDPKTCFSPAELKTVRTIYEGSRTSDGRTVQPGLMVGSEYLWPAWVTDSKSTGGSFGPFFFGYFVYDDTNWSMSDFNLDRDWPAAMTKLAGALDAADPDLRPFVRSGGKLIMYHGWDDQAISPENTLAYYGAVEQILGADARNTRLFMMPGMGHCFEGNGPQLADFLGEIDRWVDTGVAPERIVAEKPPNFLLATLGVPMKPLMTRPICAWPKVASYSGEGSLDAESSFICR